MEQEENAADKTSRTALKTREGKEGETPSPPAAAAGELLPPQQQGGEEDVAAGEAVTPLQGPTGTSAQLPPPPVPHWQKFGL